MKHAECIWRLDVDLDGDKRPDVLVGWRSGKERGLVAYLADGTAHPLSAPDTISAGVTVGWTTISDDPEHAGPFPLAVWTLGSRGRSYVAVTDTLGAHGWSAVLVGLTSDGRLGLVKDEAGVVLDVPLAADVGCVARSGDHLLVEGHGPQPAGGTVPTYAAEYFDIGDLRATLAGRRSAYGPRAVQSLQVRDCGASPRPAPVLDRLATSDKQAVLDLIRAVKAKDADQVAALVDPTFADTSTGEWEYDVFTYLTKGTNGVGWWVGHPVDNCMDIPDHECLVLGTQGYPLDLLLAHVDQRYWVVVGVKAG